MNLVIDILVAFVGTQMSTTYVKVHARVAYGSSYVIQFGFYGMYRIKHVTLDWALITSLVERWRLETHISFTG